MQEHLKQCEFLSKLNDSSINTCRITSICINGNVSVSAILKIGKKGAVIDNWNSSYFIGVDEIGNLATTAYDDKISEVTESDSGVKFEGLTYPNFSKLRKTVETFHKKYFPTLGILGWDVFIDDQQNIRVIEVNPDYPGVVGEQFCSGTFFKKQRDEIVNKILDNK